LVIASNGQRLLDFECEDSPPAAEANDEEAASIRFTPELALLPQGEPRDWLIEGCRLYDAQRLKDALEAFRMAAMTTPNCSDVHFQIGECLYRMGHVEGALERYYAAVEQDQDFLEAWTQIGCLHRELGDLQAARLAFLMSLQLLPEYPDAHFHLAETLSDLGDELQARVHWQEYLKHDSRGPWADIARQRMDDFEPDENLP
jgi:tetratricopeptide (TPR) repeat protein